MSDENLVLEDDIADEPMFSQEELQEHATISDEQATSAQGQQNEEESVVSEDAIDESVDSLESEELSSDDDDDSEATMVSPEDFGDATEEDVVSESDAQDDEEEIPVEESGPEANAQWFTLQCFSLQEHKVTHRIRQMMEAEFKDKVFQVLLPEEETVEIKNNKRQERMTKIYPGYIFVKTLPEEEIWFLLRQIPGVSKVIGSKTLPTPIAASEMDKILRQMGDKTKKIEVDFEVDEVIRVVSGPFRGYSGVISEINSDRGKLKALISIFGRETPVELDFDQVEQAVGS